MSGDVPISILHISSLLLFVAFCQPRARHRIRIFWRDAVGETELGLEELELAGYRLELVQV